MHSRTRRPRLFLLLAIITGACLPAYAQLPPELRERLRAGSEHISFSSGAGSAALLGDPTVPTIEVVVNGKRRLKFLIDFGANVVSVKKSVAQSVAARVLHPVDRRDIVEFDSIQFAGVTMRNIVAVSEPELDVDGVLGFNLFREGIVTLDYPARRFDWIRDGNLATKEQPSCLAYERRSRMPFVPVLMGDKTLYFNFDTGASGWFIVPKSIETELPFAGPPQPGPSVWNERTGRTSTTMRRLGTDLRLGTLTIPRPWVMLDPALEEADLLLGSGFLQHFRLRFDLGRRCVALHQERPLRWEAPWHRGKTPQAE